MDAETVSAVNGLAAAFGQTVAGVRCELARIDALLHDAVGGLLQAFDALGTELRAPRAAGSAQEQRCASQRIDESLDRAVTALQFQDLVSQHIAHLRGQLAGFEAAATSLARPADGAPVDGARFCEALERLRWRDAPGPVRQECMSGGSAELF